MSCAPPRNCPSSSTRTADDVVATIDAALGAGSAVCWFTDAKGRRVGIPADKIAYVEIDEDGSSKRVGFGR